MEVDLSRSWDGTIAARVGGRAWLSVRHGHLVFRWALRTAGPPRCPAGPAGFVDGLWEHDVVELFLAPGDVSGSEPAHDGRAPVRYLELEFGPKGHWLALAFGGVRHVLAELRQFPVEVAGSWQDAAWQGEAAVPLAAIEAVVGKPPWRGLVAAVLATDGSVRRTHLCWPTLPGERADFHQPEAWALLAPESEPTAR